MYPPIINLYFPTNDEKSMENPADHQSHKQKKNVKAYKKGDD